MLHRLTEGDNELREKIGKHIWEKHLFDLISDAGVYEEVFPEQLYVYSGSNSHSPDVLARQNDRVLFVDSKSTVPKIGIRLLDPDSYESNIRFVAQNIAKLYNQMHRFDRYNPFVGEVSKNMEDYWGIVVVLEDAYIRRCRYFEKAKEELKIPDNSEEWTWLIEHIKVVSLYEIERVCISGNSLIEACLESYRDDPFNFTFMGFPPEGSKFTNKGYLAFCKMFDDKVMHIIEEMRQKGAI